MLTKRTTYASPLATLFALVVLLAQTANAALISRDDPVFGVGSLTYDTLSGLEWLDVSATNDPTLPAGLRTYSQMFSATNTPGNRYFGFTHGNESQVNQLLRNSGAFAPTQSLTWPLGQTAADPVAASNLKALLGWQPNNFLAYTSIFDPFDFRRRTVFIAEPDPFNGSVRISQNEPVNQTISLNYHLLARPGSVAPPPPPPPPPPAPSVNSAARLVTGSPTGIFQSVDTPAAPFNLSFDYLFETTTGTLEARLGNQLLATIFAPGSLAPGFTTTSILVDQPSLLDQIGLELEFEIDGVSGSSVLIDNILFPGLANGDFESGDLSGWTVDASPNGSAGVVAVPVPAPQTGLILLAGLALLAGRRRLLGQ